MPGMNCEVEVHVGARSGVLAIPNAALRTPRDVGSAARVLGLSEEAIGRELTPAGYAPAGTSGSAAPEGPAGGPAPHTGDAPGPDVSDPPPFTSRYIVFALRDGAPTPVRIETGLTDLDFIEVIDGLSESDSVLVLPSAGLVRSQERFRERVGRVMGGGLPGVRSQRR
jgi:hypothetical protein